MNKNYLVVACYRFVTLPDPHQTIRDFKNFFKNRDVAGRIYISEEGLNCQMSGLESDAQSFMDYLSSHPLLAPLHFNIHRHHENIFPRMTVKYRPQLVALDCKVDVSQTGHHLPPREFRQMLENEEEKLLIDVRNDYEWEIGHFEGARLPPLTQFRDFTAYAEDLEKSVDKKKTKVLMYCTGGIRCEIYSALLKKQGFEQVYQLAGGILNYGKEEGTQKWKGKLFVFDDRMAVPIDESETPIISSCTRCETPSDTYYNCANMDCNELFLACEECLHKWLGCCCSACAEEGRLRPYTLSNKPFRRKHLLTQELEQEPQPS